jgi:para-aminobenzoate synthetase component I
VYQSKTFKCPDISEFKIKALLWASMDTHFIYLNNNNISNKFTSFPSLLAVGAEEVIKKNTGNAFDELKKYSQKNKSWLFGYFGYDLKNEIENIKSKNEDKVHADDLYFYKPLTILELKNDQVVISAKGEPGLVWEEINSTEIKTPGLLNSEKILIRQKVSKEKYFENAEKIRQHLIEGDIYELNYCMEFFAENAEIDPLKTYLKLNEISPMPFSVFQRINDTYLLCASPERFLKKENNKLISQPIKGTSKRGSDLKEDELLKSNLQNSEKEKSENMMIVDLVRNDLAKSSKPGTVKVDELFGIYSFKQVHQMVSTVSSEMRNDIHFIDAIKNAFPMGSMTGAPKIRAMELIDEYEETKRGLFSGAVGYITPDEDFDFNVVIRSILYSKKNKYISFQVGSAITYDSSPEQEYEECLLKARAMIEVLKS